MQEEKNHSDDEEVEELGEKIRVSFSLSTEVQDRSLAVPTQPIAVPADIGRKGLEAVVNHLLDRKVTRGKSKEDDDKSDDDDDDDSDSDDEEDKLPALAFDFVLVENNRIIRSGVEREARRYGLSLEEAIKIAYFPSQQAPELSDESKELPDWISSLSFAPDVGTSGILTSGTYDGTIHVYKTATKDGKGSVVKTKALETHAHSGAIMCMDVWNSQDDSVWIATGSMDQTMAVHAYDSTSNSIAALFKCHDGHESSVTSLDLSCSASKRTLASGDWNGGLCIWDLSKTEDPMIEGEGTEKRSGKKIKTGSKSSSTAATILAPTLSIDAHVSNISGISWGNWNQKLDSATTTTTSPQNQLITGSWDHSLKTWDITAEASLLTLNCSKVIACLDTSYHSEGIVATGHPDCTIRLWDMRVSKEQGGDTNNALSVFDKTFRPSHGSWVSKVKWSRENPFQVASTSHDGTVKVWDVRSSIPLHSSRTFPKMEKGLCLVYGENRSDGHGGTQQSLYVGGTDCLVKHLEMKTQKS